MPRRAAINSAPAAIDLNHAAPSALTAPPTPNIRALLWVDSNSAPLIRRVLELSPMIAALGIGAASRSVASDLASILRVEPIDDLRVALTQHRPDYLLLGSPDGLRREALAAARHAACRILTLEPLTLDSASTPEPAAPPNTADSDDNTDAVVESSAPPPIIPSLSLAPRLRAGAIWLAAADPLTALGSPRAAQLTALAPPGHTSLFARLFDAFDTLLAAFGLAETIDASLTGALANPPDDPRGLTGHLTAHLRFTDGASALLLASDRAPRWSRRLTLLGSAASIELDDHRYRLLAPDGSDLDREAADASPDAGAKKKSARSSRAKSSRRKAQTFTNEPIDPAQLIAAQWHDLIRRATPSTPAVSPNPLSYSDRPIDDRQILACCQAALLSCKTGSAESPARLLDLSGG